MENEESKIKKELETKTPQTVLDTLASMSTKGLIDAFEATEEQHDQNIAMVRGWLMDELERRDQAKFTRWIESNVGSPRLAFLGVVENKDFTANMKNLEFLKKVREFIACSARMDVIISYATEISDGYWAVRYTETLPDSREEIVHINVHLGEMSFVEGSHKWL